MSADLHTWRRWALARIRICRSEEERFSHSTKAKRIGDSVSSDVAICASTERRALEASLRMLDVECTHAESEKMRLSERGGLVRRCVECLAVTEGSP